MRPKLVIAGLLSLGAGMAVYPVLASVSFTGPGWYLEDGDQTLDNVLVSGPYAEKAQCEAVRPEDTDDDQYICLYEQTDPTVSSPPRRLGRRGRHRR